MRVGICILPEYPWREAQPRWRRAQELGFDHAWTYDHLVWGGLVGHRWYATMPTLTAAAMVTDRIELGTFVSSPNFRHPMTFLRDIQSLADISQGRFVVGVGSGGEPDGTILGGPPLTPREKVDRLDEFTALLSTLLTQDHVDHHGRWFSTVDARTEPLAPARPDVAMLVAANGPKAMRVAVRRGQGWVTTGPPRAQDLAHWWRGVDELSRRFTSITQDEGREGVELRRVLSIDSSGSYCLQSIGAFDDAVGRAQELGFTDVVTHWPRSSAPYQGREAVLDEVGDRLAAR